MIALDTLVRVAIILDAADPFARLFEPAAVNPASLADLEKLHPPARKRGRTQP